MKKRLHQAGWKKTLDSSIKKCFKKIRLGGKQKETEISKLMNERIKLKMSLKKASIKDKEGIEHLVKEQEVEINKRMENENFKRVSDNLKSMSDTTGSLNTNGMWVMKKKIFPSKRRGAILAKKNAKGKLVTNPAELKKLYLDTFVSRLRHRKIKPGFEELKFL